jgi:hypothetical protein
MKSLFTALLVLLTLFPGAYAKKNKEKAAGAYPYNIIEASAVSVTVAVGKAGDTDSQRTFKITDATKVIIDSLPSSGSDLKGGMVAAIKTEPDGETATEIKAHDPNKKK